MGQTGSSFGEYPDHRVIRLFGFSRNHPRLAGEEEVLVAAENLKQVTTPRALTTREEEASREGNLMRQQ